MKKIAIIADCDIYDRKGHFNAVHNRTKYLKQIANYEIDAYLIQTYEPFIVRFLRKTHIKKRPNFIEIDNVKYHLLWHRFSLIDYVLSTYLKLPQYIRLNFLRKKIHLFQNYDLISSHTIFCGLLASWISKKYGIPFCNTWHGSDINVAPQLTNFYKKAVRNILEKAEYNFFVSNALCQNSRKWGISKHDCILYNGVDDKFCIYPENQKSKLRQQFNVSDKKVVAFVGGLVPVKNIVLLPTIFSGIYKLYPQIIFWVIGDGKLKSYLERETSNLPIILWGNQEIVTIPDFMNCIDVLVLPSKNEGLPLVTVEALACGCNVVGSNVGGIPEVIGSKNVFDISDKHGINDFVNRVYLMLKQKIEQPLNQIFSWEETAQIENNIYMKYL